ncbi:MAG: hypothetical protein IPH31_23775 [Lewinellaceae bacterium]|nr:hypothetical protein [Lewinellaceae bacterium]
MKNFFLFPASTLAHIVHIKGFAAAIILLKASASIAFFLLYTNVYGAPLCSTDHPMAKTYGGSAFEELYSIQQTTDGGFVTISVTLSNNGDVTGNHGGVDFWVVKLTESGAINGKRHMVAATTNGRSRSNKPMMVAISWPDWQCQTMDMFLAIMGTEIVGW